MVKTNSKTKNSEEDLEFLESYDDIEANSLKGRICLMRGDITNASKFFDAVEVQVEKYYKGWIQRNQDEHETSEFHYKTIKWIIKDFT